MSATTAATRTDALPPVPLTEDLLAELLANDGVREVWVPDGRPANVYTLAGAHEGDILEFWLETDEAYVSFKYTVPDRDELGLAWYRHEPAPKDDTSGALVEEALEDYRPLEGGRGSA